MNRSLLTSFLLILMISQVYAQSFDLTFPDTPALSDKFKNSIATQISEFERLFHKEPSAKDYSTLFMLDKIDNDSNYSYLFLAEFWIAFHYKEIIPELVKRVAIKKEIGLTNSADLIILERVKSKQMELYGHGEFCGDDLFTIAGRANRLLKVITGEDFGRVSMHSTEEQLSELQRKWVKWLIQIKKVKP
jgi:hypothetical protein